ncbi:sensor histidine kinase [Dyella amyloliquefaciens]|uniref:sensor histidine kinase n=1 Tax=Dyella amyloliquefaciens TaxID=1770545 RepID=UPI00102ED32F|nr:ATP-binding protein [Dyella amyloliquefaciens]
MKRWPAIVLLGIAALLLCACARHAGESSTTVRTLDRADAVRSNWDAATPPESGWTPVALPDTWTRRWAAHDGVVWYRLQWFQADDAVPVGLLLDYVCLADAVYLNGSLIHRDPQLVEPLTRSWIKPQFFLLDRPLLRRGQNELLVRVSGLAAYQPGFGRVRVGDPAEVRARYETHVRWQYDSELFSGASGIVLGGIFGMFWLFRRKDAVYGWYALSAWLFAAYGSNYVTRSPWPFASTDGWQAFVAVLYVAAAFSFAVFLLRYCEKRWPWTERVLGLLCAVFFVYALLWPASAGPHRAVMILMGGGLYYVAIVAFIVRAVRVRRMDQRILAACLLIPLLTSSHDFLVFFGIANDSAYLLALTSPLTMIGLGSVLAHRFYVAMRRVEHFNVELHQEVEQATRRLSETLAREHQLAIANTRASERLNLVRDVHDGFGGSLLGTIVALENSPATSETTAIVGRLKELRDDLRLIIDTTAQERDTDLAGLLASLRHRWSHRFEVAGVESRWQLAGAERLHLGAARSLDLLRFLQEALTNVLKHAQASNVSVVVRRDCDDLIVEVIDDGVGFDSRVSGEGLGLASLQARADRLAARFDLRACPGEGTAISLTASVFATTGATEDRSLLVDRTTGA